MRPWQAPLLAPHLSQKCAADAASCPFSPLPQGERGESTCPARQRLLQQSPPTPHPPPPSPQGRGGKAQAPPRNDLFNKTGPGGQRCQGGQSPPLGKLGASGRPKSAARLPR